MAHFPYPWGRTAKDLAERPECKTEPIVNPETGDIYPLLNGHVHETWMLNKNSLNVGWDIFHKPISTEKVWEIYQATNGFMDTLDFRRDLIYT